MNEKTCEAIAERLVGYADGELSSAEAKAVETHLLECEPCRMRVDALRRSLRLANVIWEDALESVPPISLPEQQTAKKRLWYWKAAAVFLLAMMIGWIWMSISKPPALLPTQEEPTFESIQREVGRAGRAAELLAAADLLGKTPGGEAIARENYRLVLDHYADTPAAGEAKTRIQTLERTGEL